MMRTAIVKTAGGSPSRSTVEAYLPKNYKVMLTMEVDGKPAYLIAGEDDAGWTLDGYVIPRLGSGLIAAYETDPETGARL